MRVRRRRRSGSRVDAVKDLSLADLREMSVTLVARVPAERFGVDTLAEDAGVPVEHVRRLVADTATLLVGVHRRWYQRLAVRLDPLLEDQPPGPQRLHAIMGAWLDLALDTPGWPALLRRFAGTSPLDREVRHQLRRLTGLATVDLAVAGHPSPRDAAALIVRGLADVACREADAGYPLTGLRRQLLAPSPALMSPAEAQTAAL